MKHTTHALLITLFVVWGLEEEVLSQRGQCVGNRCFAVFQQTSSFTDGQKRCADAGGHLMTVQSLQAHETVSGLLSGLSGDYWIGLQLPDGRCPDNASQLYGYRWITGDVATDFHSWGGFDNSCSSKCVSASADSNSTWRQAPCHNTVQGFLCQYSFDDMCGRVQVKGDARVEYTTSIGFDGDGLATFPPGTIAVKTLLDNKDLDSKYICFSANWTQAPWNCEVLGGGCENGCVSENKQSLCTCPTAQPLHANNITCAKDPCAGCAHQCLKEGDTYTCRCHQGYSLARDRERCVDVDECEDENSCTDENQECMNTDGGFECMCREGFVEDDGECVNNEICDDCEHILCEKSGGVYRCACRRGFKVSEEDPTKCDFHCTEQDCLADCQADMEKQGSSFCYCPVGYIRDTRNDTAICTDINECEEAKQCDHKCVNTFGSYRCLCAEGFELLGGHQCVPGDEGSGSTPPNYVTAPTSIRPTAVPSYVKAGSLLGIAVFIALCAALLYFLVRNALKRCGKLELASLRGPDVDIFHLQQVTTEKYKKFSFDKQWKNDSQRL